MPYDPSDALYVKVEIDINGVWTEVTSRAYGGRAASGVTIKQGRGDGSIQAETARCELTLGNDDGYVTEGNPESPWYPYIGRGTRLRVSLSGITGSDEQRFAGRIDTIQANYPGGSSSSMRITAIGTLGFMGQNSDPLQPALERAILATNPLAHWALTDESGARTGASALAAGTPMRPRAGVPAFGSATGAQAGAGAAVVSLNAASVAGVISGASAAAWTVTFCAKSDESATGAIATIYLKGGTWSRIDLLPEVGGTDLTLYQVHRTGGVTDSDSANVADWAGVWHHYAIVCEQVGGNVDTTVYCDGVEVMGQILAVITLGAPELLELNSLQYTGPMAAMEAAQASVHDGAMTALEVADLYQAALGWVGEQAHERVERLMTEEGFDVSVTGSTSVAMGPQLASPLVTLVGECEIADQGLLHDGGADGAVVYVCSSALVNQAPALAVLSGTLEPDLKPTWDNYLTRNDVTSSRPGGSSARYTDPAHIAKVGGRFLDFRQPNVESDDQLLDDASWSVNTGTADGPRYAGVGLNMRNTDGATYADDVLALTLGGRFTAAAETLPPQHPPGGIDSLVVGWVELLDAVEWTMRLQCVPYSPYLVAEFDDAGTARFAADGSTIDHAIDSDDTSWSVLCNGTRWTTDSADFATDMLVTVGGEVVSLSDISNAVAVVATGTASHGNGSSVTPSLPAGLAAGHQMFMLVACRNTAVTINTPAGWSFIGNVGSANIRFYARTATSSESAPTVTFNGAVAGDDTSGQIVAFEGVSNDFIMASSNQSNASAQDIDYPSLTLVGIDGETDQCLLILCGWKQDNWTSVAVPSGWTEIGEPSTATGNDQGIYWAWRRQLGRADIQAGSLVVTGGAAAISRSRLIAYAGYQTDTVSARSVNGVEKSHAAGSEVQVYRPLRLAL